MVPAALDVTRSASGTSLSTERLQRLVFVFVFTFAKGFGENMVFIKTGRGVSKGSKKNFFKKGVLHLVCCALGMSTAVRRQFCVFAYLCISGCQCGFVDLNDVCGGLDNRDVCQHHLRPQSGR